MPSKNIAKPADIRTKTDKELDTRLSELRKEQFNLRFQKATGQLQNTSRQRIVKKEIARIATIAGQRVREAAPQATKPTAAPAAPKAVKGK